jgi:hypothetical protein
MLLSEQEFVMGSYNYKPKKNDPNQDQDQKQD